MENKAKGDVCERVRAELFAAQDTEYRAFASSLIPTVDKESVIGVRVPFLRKYAKSMSYADAEAFMSSLPHSYLEENYLHAFLISLIGDFERAVLKTELFLPYVDNWAVCDGMRPRIFAKNTDKLISAAEKWIKSDHVYTVRFGIGMLHSYFLGDAFTAEHLHLAANAACDEYYVNMMIAWYFCYRTCKAKGYGACVC